MRLDCYRIHICVEDSLFAFNTEQTIGINREELEKDKKNIFKRSLYKEIEVLNEQSRESDDHKYTASIMYKDEEQLFFRFGKVKNTKIYEENLQTSKNVDNWDCFINIFVEFNKQIICIENTQKISFKTFEKVFVKKVKTLLAEKLLDLELICMGNTTSFWEFIEANKGYISELTVELVSRNMSSQDSQADKLLKRMRANFCAQQTMLKLNNQNGKLVLNDEDPDVCGFGSLVKEGIARVGMTSLPKPNEPAAQRYSSQSDKSRKSLQIPSSQINESLETKEKNYIKSLFETIKKLL